MSAELGTEQRPLRVAVVGSGPSGFYAAESLCKSDVHVKVDMFDRLPAPFGLVRYGVAPDHQKIKNVIKVYEKTAARPEFSFFGNVDIGKDISIEQLRQYYDAVLFSVGAASDRKLGIPGEDLPGSYTATEFVAWYNGHPDYRDCKFDLSQEVAVVIGQGNVAMDVSRILCKTTDELQQTDIAKHALDALAESKIKEVHLIGRRGPAQAAFTPVEIREFGELSDCAPVFANPGDLELSPTSQAELEDPKNAPKKKNYDILCGLRDVSNAGKSKAFHIHFFQSPTALLKGEGGQLAQLELERNELTGEPGKQKARGTGEKFVMPCGIFFRSVGYRGVPIDGVPFHEQWGIFPNTAGRIQDGDEVVPGLYTAGWIKRGPSGVIGTNKPDSEETVNSLLADLGGLPPCQTPDTEQLISFLSGQGVRFVQFNDWKKIDAAEIAKGQESGKIREKFVAVEDMLALLD